MGYISHRQREGSAIYPVGSSLSAPNAARRLYWWVLGVEHFKCWDHWQQSSIPGTSKGSSLKGKERLLLAPDVPAKTVGVPGTGWGRDSHADMCMSLWLPVTTMTPPPLSHSTM